MTTCLNCGHEDETEFHFCPQCGTKAPESVDAHDALLGRTLNGKYRAVAEIGAGAMGTVYLGEHIGLKKKVALKVLHPDLQLTEEALERFQREGIAAGRFSHPNAIQIFDFDRDEGPIFYLAMEYVEGSNLKVFLRRKGRLAVPVALRLTRQILSVLAEAHKNGIVHRDLKPDNIMIESGSRGELRVKVLDFGLSKLVNAGVGGMMQTQVGRILGTPLYMSPEQCAGEEADARSDIYAVGLMLYEMITGLRPFHGESTTELMLTRASEEAPSLLDEHPELDVPEELDDAIVLALARERDERFQTAEDMLQALELVPVDGMATTISATRSQLAVEHSRASARPGSGGRSGAKTRARSSRGRRARGEQDSKPSPVLLLAAGAGLALLGFGLWYALGRGSGSGAERPGRVSQIAAADRTPEEGRYVNLLEEARGALRLGKGDEAFAAADRALLLPCRDAEAFLLRAETFIARNDVDSALADYREVLSLEPENTEARLAMGWAYFDEGDLPAAKRRFEEAAQRDSDSPDVKAALGALALVEGDREEASEKLGAAVAAAPESARAQLYFGRLKLEAGESAAAIEALVQAKRQAPRAWEANALLGEAYLLEDRDAEAEARLREALDMRPQADDVRIELAALCLETQRTQEALTLLSAPEVRASEDGRLYVLLGIVEQLEGRVPQAIDALEKGLRLGADERETRHLLGLCLQQAGRLDDALAAFERSIEVDEQLAAPHLSRGLVLFELGRYADAALSIEAALERDESLAEAHYHLGLLHKDYLGDLALAKTHLTRYRELGGARPRVDAWLAELDR